MIPYLAVTKKHLNMKNTIFTLLAIFTIGMLHAQTDKAPKTQTVVIKTSAECGSCKERIEGKLNYTKGISFSELNYDTKELTVKFKTDKISIDEIRKILSELGYDADEVKANPKTQKELPACCQPGGMK